MDQDKLVAAGGTGIAWPVQAVAGTADVVEGPTSFPPTASSPSASSLPDLVRNRDLVIHGEIERMMTR